jgi:RNA polymerase sigma-70 factor (ECF subfamily)
LALIAQKDADAYARFYDRYARTVFNLLLRIIRDAPMAEELLQDTFWQIWQKADQFAGRGAAAAWLMRIARNRALDHLRSRRRHVQAYEATLEHLDHVASTPRQTTEQAVEQGWLQQDIAAALSQLPNEQRACLELAYFEGLSQTEIAAHTHLPVGTIKTRLRIGRDKVERRLRAFGYNDSYGTHLT